MTLSSALVNVPVGLLEVPLEVLSLVAPELPPDPLEPPDASTPTTLNVTVNGSLFGLLNFKLRLLEISPPVNMLSVPTVEL